MPRDEQPAKKRALMDVACLAVIALAFLLLRAPFAGNKQHVSMRDLKQPYNPNTYIGLALRIDSNDVPTLTRALETKPGAFDKAYASVWAATPLPVRTNLPRPLDSAAADQIRGRASSLLSDVGVPPSTIVKELQDPFWAVRMNGLAYLSTVLLPKFGRKGLQDQKATIYHLVLAEAQDLKMEVRMSAVYCLGYFSDAAAEVLPVLSKALSDSYPDVRIRAAMAFYRLDPAQAEKAGALSTAFDCLHTNGPMGAQYLAMEFLQKQGKLPPTKNE